MGRFRAERTAEGRTRFSVTPPRPASSAAAITSSSRIEPPGWITAVAPASTAASRPSAKGKKASDATAEADRRGVAQPALSASVLRLPCSDARGFEAVHLAGADAGRGAVLGRDDRVRLDVLGDRPGEAADRPVRRSVGWRFVTTLRSGAATCRAARPTGLRHCHGSGPARPPAIDLAMRPFRAASGRSPVAAGADSSSRRR